MRHGACFNNLRNHVSILAHPKVKSKQRMVLRLGSMFSLEPTLKSKATGINPQGQFLVALSHKMLQ